MCIGSRQSLLTSYIPDCLVNVVIDFPSIYKYDEIIWFGYRGCQILLKKKSNKIIYPLTPPSNLSSWFSCTLRLLSCQYIQIVINTSTVQTTFSLRGHTITLLIFLLFSIIKLMMNELFFCVKPLLSLKFWHSFFLLLLFMFVDRWLVEKVSYGKCGFFSNFVQLKQHSPCF